MPHGIHTAALSPGGGASDILADYVAAAFFRAGYVLPPTTADSRYYHDGCGNIHCGTNVRRTIPSYKWWEN